MSDHDPDTSAALTDPVARGPEEEAVCGPVCVSAGACTCGGGQDEAAPGRDPAAGASGSDTPAGAVWAPPECTLPVLQQPERTAEFDTLFATAVGAVARPAPTTLRLVLHRGYEAEARDLTARESDCCAFFTFAFTRRPDGLHWEITVPEGQVAVLDALAASATAAVRGAAR